MRVGLPLVLLSLAALIAILFGIRYFMAKAFMPYHATVAGKSWSELGPGLQTIILGMLRIIGGGFMTYGVALRRHAPSAGTPVLPASIVLGLALAGAGLSFR